MKDSLPDIDALDWDDIAGAMHEHGYAIVPRFLSVLQCRNLIDLYENPVGYRKTVVMERYRFGLGEYKYWDYPLPDLVQHLRLGLYPRLAPIANCWMQELRIDRQFPATFQALKEQCRDSGQMKPTPLLLRYGKGGFNTLHQDLYGDIYFPLQIACFLSQPGRDYEGGEFVLVQQNPRAQSKAIVLRPQQGDMIIFTTTFRPVKGARGYFRVNMKHGVSEVHGGERYTMGVIFHEAAS